MSARSAWRVFGVSASSAVQWAQQWRKTGNLDAGKVGGHKRVILESERDWLLNRIEIKQDLTLHELLAELRDSGAWLSAATRCGGSWGGSWGGTARHIKKTIFAKEQDRPKWRPPLQPLELDPALDRSKAHGLH
jgi:hypothetical protein